MYASFPRVWNNIYSSWNLGFVSNYKNWPSFFAKLLNPATCGTYQTEDAGLYIWPRVITLYLHIHHEMINRAAARSKEPEGLDWRSERVTEVFGKVNLVAARLYRDRIDGVIDERHGSDHGGEGVCLSVCLSVCMYVCIDVKNNTLL